MNNDPRRSISCELIRLGLRPNPECFDYISARLEHMGELEYERLLRHGQAGLKQKATTIIRLLGFGHVMTEFAVAHLGFRGKPDPAVLSLGALSNLIVSTYDGLLDSGRDPERILPRSRLLTATRKTSADHPLIGRLVDLYFAGVAALPYRHACVHKTLRTAILRMYDAERATAGSNEYAQWVWRRKSALPFVILGLPVWMTVPRVEQRVYRAHLKWLYRLGQFFGWMDDAADLDEDRAAGRPNYFAAGFRRSVARRIARQGSLILGIWDATAPKDRYCQTLRETFLAVTWSWLNSKGQAKPRP